MRPMSDLARRSALATVIIAVALGVFAMNDIPIGIFQDDGHYVILARALAHGDGYRYTNLPGAPAATHFPPGYPLLLMPLWWVAPKFPANVAFFKLLNVALLPLVALAVRSLARRLGGLGDLTASALAVVSVASVPVLYLNGLLFSETAFMAALLAMLPALERLAGRAGATPRVMLGWGLAIGALSLLRTVGVTLLPAAVCVLALRRRYRDAAWLTVGALLLLVPWQVWSALHAHAVPAVIAGGYGGYGAWLADAWRAGGVPFVASTVAVNLQGLQIPLTLFGLAASSPLIKGTAAAILVLLAGAGALRMWPRAPVTVALFVPYGALLLLWPFPPDRFLWPLWPVFLVLIAVGVQHLGNGPRPASVRWAVRAAAVAAALAWMTWHVRTWPTRSWENGERANARMGLAAASVAARLPSDGLVASDQDAMVHLYAGRPAVPLLALTAVQHVRRRTDAEVAEQLAGVLDAFRPRWVIVAERESLRAAQQLALRGRLRLLGADTAGVLVYDVLR